MNLQRHLFGLASLACSPAHAQSSIAVFGDLDTGAQHVRSDIASGILTEALRDPVAFRNAALKTRRAGKQMAALKNGRSAKDALATAGAHGCGGRSACRARGVRILDALIETKAQRHGLHPSQRFAQRTPNRRTLAKLAIAAALTRIGAAHAQAHLGAF